MSKKKISIIGGAGLSGQELIHYLKNHPHVELHTLTSDKFAGKAIAQCFPRLYPLDHTFAPNSTDCEGTDLAFLAVPNKASLDKARQLLDRNIRVIDLSGVYRLRDLNQFKQYYQLDHTQPQLLSEAVFGLPEYFAAQIAAARLITNPGCYATGSLLGLLPFGELLAELETAPIIDAKSGVSGAGGRVEDDATNFISVNENFKAYKPFTHQQTPEISQYLEDLTPFKTAIHGPLIFTPYLLPIDRGILSTIYLRFKRPVEMAEVRSKFEALCSKQALIQLLPPNELPELKHVQMTNRCMIGLAQHESKKHWLVVTAIDNLVKGAAGQAIQNMNLMFGWEQNLSLN